MINSSPITVIANMAVFLASIILVLDGRSAEPAATQLNALLDRLVQEGSVAGAQVVVGESHSPLATKNFGVRDIKDRKPVNDETRFCIGSCSKMFAAAVLLSLASEETIDLDAPIDRWLKDFADPKLEGGGNASRAPTLRELLCHRAGIYSQRNRLTSQQTRWIRDFKLTLAESVDGIAVELLSVEPGNQFAYSGAGYCVLGRVAEVAADKPFDELLQLHVGRPLKLLRTTYFPSVDDDNVATGHALQDGKLSIAELTPHLQRKQHRLALIGGSIYAPAHETAEFARMLLQKGTAHEQEFLSPTEWEQMTKVHSPHPGGGYGLGVSIAIDAKTGEVQSVSHGGALYGSLSHISVDFRTRRFGVVNFTGQRTRKIGEALQAWVSSTSTER